MEDFCFKNPHLLFPGEKTCNLHKYQMHLENIINMDNHTMSLAERLIQLRFCNFL